MIATYARHCPRRTSNSHIRCRSGRLCLYSPASAAPCTPRAHEMVWVGRAEDDHPPLIDFKTSGWQVRVQDAVATIESTRGNSSSRHVGKLTHRRRGRAEVRVRAPMPVATDAVTLWCYGNNWGWTTDPPRRALPLSSRMPKAEFSVPSSPSTGRWFLPTNTTPARQPHRRAPSSPACSPAAEQDRTLTSTTWPSSPSSSSRAHGASPFLASHRDQHRPGQATLPHARHHHPARQPGRGLHQHAASGGGPGRRLRIHLPRPDGRLTYRIKPATWMTSPPPTPRPHRSRQSPPSCNPAWRRRLPPDSQRPGRPKRPSTRTQVGTTSNPATAVRRRPDGRMPRLPHGGKSLVIDVLSPAASLPGTRPRRGPHPSARVTSPSPRAAARRRGQRHASVPLFLTGNADWYLSSARCSLPPTRHRG
jgi:hypothetical protein